MQTYRLLSFLAIAFTVVACGGSASPAPQSDLSVAADQAPSPDQATPTDSAASLTCAQTVACIQHCTQANTNTCVPACLQQMSSAAQAYFNPLQQCAQPACYSATDAGAPACADPSSTGCSACIATNCASQLQACEQH